MKRHILILAGLLTLCCGTIHAQARKGLKINEVMVSNDSNAIDEYGRRSAWIELYNSNFASMEISSVFLTNDTTNHKLYPVPLGDVRTRVPKRGSVVFWADGRPTDGTFHTSFTLDPNKENVIAIYDADGNTLIDCVTVPVLQPGQSYARITDGVGARPGTDEVEADFWSVRSGTATEGDYITPGSPNKIKGTNPKIEQFQDKDPDGFAMTITAMGIVFTALLLLSICFWTVSRFNAARASRKKLEAHGIETADAVTSDTDTGEVIAAIAMALRDHTEAHDRESAILTINSVRKAYSPWSSHIYTLRHMPDHRGHR